MAKSSVGECELLVKGGITELSTVNIDWKCVLNAMEMTSGLLVAWSLILKKLAIEPSGKIDFQNLLIKSGSVT